MHEFLRTAITIVIITVTSGTGCGEAPITMKGYDMGVRGLF